MLEYFSNYKLERFSSLKQIHLSHGPKLQKIHVLETFKELENDQYEHMEQAQEFEEVMEERIDELQKIVEDQQDNFEDEEEFLSFFKGGVPHDRRSFYYQSYEHGFLDFQNANAETLSAEQKKAKNFLKQLILTGMISFRNNHEFFILETLIVKIVSLFVKKYAPIIIKPNSPGDCIIKLPFEHYIRFFGLAAFVTQNPNVGFKFFEVIYHKVALTTDPAQNVRLRHVEHGQHHGAGLLLRGAVHRGAQRPVPAPAQHRRAASGYRAAVDVDAVHRGVARARG